MSGYSILSQLTLPGNGHPYPTIKNQISRLFTVQALLWLALLLALAGSLRHLASMFASIDGSLFYGYLSAIAVDAGVFALSYSLRQRKVANRGTLVLWVGVILFTGISIYGNYAYGLTAVGQPLPTWIMASRPVVLAASLPILVLYLAELVSDNQQYANQAARRQLSPPALRAADTAAQSDTAPQPAMTMQARSDNGSDNGRTLADVNANRQATKEERKAQLAAILANNPQASNSELATRLDVSRGTIRNYKAELKANGRLS